MDAKTEKLHKVAVLQLAQDHDLGDVVPPGLLQQQRQFFHCHRRINAPTISQVPSVHCSKGAGAELPVLGEAVGRQGQLVVREFPGN